MNLRPTLFQATLFIVLFVTFAGTVIAWSGPSAAAPSGNVDAPINVSGTSQIKNGALGVNSLAVYGNSQVGKLTFSGVGGDSGATSHRGRNDVADFRGQRRQKEAADPGGVKGAVRGEPHDDAHLDEAADQATNRLAGMAAKHEDAG